MEHDILYANFGCVNACARSVWQRPTLCNPIKADKKSQLSNASD